MKRFRSALLAPHRNPNSFKLLMVKVIKSLLNFFSEFRDSWLIEDFEISVCILSYFIEILKINLIFNSADGKCTCGFFIVSYYLLPFFWQQTKTSSEECSMFHHFPRNDSIFGFFLIWCQSAAQTKHVPSIRTSNNRKKQSLVDTADEIGLPNWVFSIRFWLAF